MNCDSVRRWLESMDADEADAIHVGEHLEDCDACRAFAEVVDSGQLIQLQDLPEEIAPPAELWQQIDTRIQDERVVSAPFGARRSGRDWPQLLSIVAAVAAVIFLAIVIRPAVEPVPTQSIGYTDSGLAAAMEQQFRGAMRVLTMGQIPGPLDPRVTALLAGAEEVDRAIADTRLAIEREGEKPRMMASLARLCRVRLRLAEQAQNLSRG